MFKVSVKTGMWHNTSYSTADLVCSVALHDVKIHSKLNFVVRTCGED